MAISVDSNPDDTLRKFEAALSRTGKLQEDIDTTDAKVKARNELRVGRDRSGIAITIIVTYAIAIALALIYLLYSTPNCDAAKLEDCIKATGLWKTQAELVRDLIVTVILPIVTLMLGFYFGTETSKPAATVADPD